MKVKTKEEKSSLQTVWKMQALQFLWIVSIFAMTGTIIAVINQLPGFMVWIDALPRLYRSLASGLCSATLVLGSIWLTGLLTKELSDRIVSQSDKRSLGGLLSVYNLSQFSPGRKAITRKLTEILPSVEPLDTKRLSLPHWNIIRRILRSKDVVLVMATLEGARAFGDQRLLGAVSQLSQGKYAAKNNPEIRERAKHCLSFLRTRKHGRTPDDELLRPSPLVEPPQTLLRPLSGKPQESPETLLRADPSRTKEDAPDTLN